MAQRTWLVALGAIAAAIWLILAVANLYLGDLNQDEGWYLYAARQAAQGEMPYRDFAFTQGPVMVYGYALANGLVDRWGLAGGRLFTAFLAMLGLAAAAWLASRMVPARQRGAAAVLALVVVGVNVYQSYFTTVVKTYALAGLLLTAGLLLLSFAAGRARVVLCVLSGVVLTLAAGTRISAGVALPAAFLYLVLQVRLLGWGCPAGFALGSIATAGAALLPFYLRAPDGFLFGVAGYHALRSAGDWPSLFVYKAGFLSRMVQGYVVAMCLWAGLVLMHLMKPFGQLRYTKETAGPPFLPALAWALVGGVTLVHLSAPFPYDDYQVMVYPVFGAVLASALVRHVATLKVAAALKGDHPAPDVSQLLWLTIAVLVVSAMASFSSPINQDWFSRGRDRIWWLIKDEPSLKKLQDVAANIREQTRPEDLLLTQDAYLAVEARRPLPRGLEMGPFSLFADWTRSRAETLHVLNREMLMELLSTTDAPLAAFSGYGLAIKAPDVEPLPKEEQELLWHIVLGRYEEIEQVPNFGQAHTTLRILALKPVPEPEGP